MRSARPAASFELCWGPQQELKAVVAPRAALDDRARPVGRARSRRRSRLLTHAAVEVGRRARAAAPPRRRGAALLSGQAVTTVAPIGHGEWIRVGAVDLLFHVEALTPARGRASAARPGRGRAGPAGAAARLRASCSPCLTPAAEPRIAELVRESVVPWRSLFDGVEGAAACRGRPARGERCPHRPPPARRPRARGLGAVVGACGSSATSRCTRCGSTCEKFLLVQREEGTPSRPTTSASTIQADCCALFLGSCTRLRAAQWFSTVIRCTSARTSLSPSGWWRTRRALKPGGAHPLRKLASSRPRACDPGHLRGRGTPTPASRGVTPIHDAGTMRMRSLILLTTLSAALGAVPPRSGTASGSETSTATTPGDSETASTQPTSIGDSNGGIPTAPECQEDADCVVFNDCCAGAPRAEEHRVPGVRRDLPRSTCERPRPDGRPGRVQLEEVRVAKVTCSDGPVTCDEAKPQCGEGTVNSVADNCWAVHGPALLRRRPPLRRLLRRRLDLRRPQSGASNCVPVPFECSGGTPTCACLEPYLDEFCGGSCSDAGAASSAEGGG